MTQIRSGIFKTDVTKSVNLFLHPLKFLCLFCVFTFSVDGFACEDVSDSIGDTYIAAAPNDPVRNYTEGYARFCLGRDDGVDYIGKASDLGHVTASYFLGEYHRRDKDFNSGGSLPTTQENYDAAIFYYERTAKLVEDTSNYPDGAHRDVSEIEGQKYMSIRTFMLLTSLYFEGYSRALGDMLENDVSYTDTIQVLENMKSAADRCLRRPSLSVWGARQSEIANSKQVICQAHKDFAEQVINLEYQRIEIAKRCDVALNKCTEHQGIFQKMVQKVQEMINKINSVPAI